jgi:hypothetical protein
MLKSPFALLLAITGLLKCVVFSLAHLVVTTVEIRDRLPRGNGELQDQSKRASLLCLQGV